MVVTLVDTVSPDSFYNIGGHILFYLLITAHLCLFVDLSPLQKHPMCQLNFLLASCIAAVVPSGVTSQLVFASPVEELAVGIGIAVLMSVLVTVFIQRVFDVRVEF